MRLLSSIQTNTEFLTRCNTVPGTTMQCGFMIRTAERSCWRACATPPTVWCGHLGRNNASRLMAAALLHHRTLTGDEIGVMIFADA